MRFQSHSAHIHKYRKELISLLQGWRREGIEDLQLRLARIRFLSPHIHIWTSEWEVVDAIRNRIIRLQKELYNA